jgi:hypothetical protein
MQTEKFADSLESGTHAALSKLTGNWKGIAHTYFDPGVLADSSPVEATFRPVLGSRFMMMEYQGALQGKPLEGLAIIGFYMLKREYTVAWIDTFHTGTLLLISQGKKSDLDVMGYYSDPSGGPDWGWRTTIEQANENQFTLRHFNVMPDGVEALAVETVFEKQ